MTPARCDRTAICNALMHTAGCRTDPHIRALADRLAKRVPPGGLRISEADAAIIWAALYAVDNGAFTSRLIDRIHELERARHNLWNSRTAVRKQRDMWRHRAFRRNHAA